MNTRVILSVSELTNAIKQKLEGVFALIAVQGEVSNLRKQASGHLYFTLKDSDSQISSVLFRGTAAHLSRIPKEGDQLIIRGALSVYAPRGTYQIIVREVEFSGTGQLLQRLHELKIKLQGLGWLDKEHKKPLPPFPKTIGVITSPTGSVIQDILNILSRRHAGFHVILNPVRVQGREAAGEIAEAIKAFNTYKLADVLIVGRGGGSLEDLWPFNEEIVAKAIFESELPIISAVGHETDFTLCDFVADLRAPTPSAAAELVTLEKTELLKSLMKMEVRLAQTMQTHLRSHKHMLSLLAKQPPFRSPYTLLSKYLQLVDGLIQDVGDAIDQLMTKWRLAITSLERQKEALKPGSQVVHMRKNFEMGTKELTRIMNSRLSQEKERIEKLKNHLQAINPRNLLKKGFSIAFHEKNDSVILSTSEVKKGDRLKIQFSDGNILVKVEDNDI